MSKFDGMTPQEAAEAALKRYLMPIETEVEVKLNFAAACQHFYERGRADAIDLQADVREFMEAFGQALLSCPQWPDDDTMDLRMRLKGEEFMEWVRDSGYTAALSIERFIGEDPPGTEKYTDVFDKYVDGKWRDFPKSADALIDLLYVTIGTLSAMGINMWPLWAEVQRANMAKTGGPVVNGKQMKPDGWTPPDIEALLRAQGWECEDA